jgi:hypothetical protein
MRMAYPPAEVQKAEEDLSTENAKTYTLVPSKSAAKDAASFNLELAANDLPIFVADRLAFGDPNGGLKVRLIRSIERESVEPATLPFSHLLSLGPALSGKE